jgi:hypothetical protein
MNRKEESLNTSNRTFWKVPKDKKKERKACDIHCSKLLYISIIRKDNVIFDEVKLYRNLYCSLHRDMILL